VLSRNVTKLSITLVLDISHDSAPISISRVLRDRRQPKSEAVFRILSLVSCVPAIITSSLFIIFEHTSNDWKVEKFNYEFGITSFLR
jgi:hypothetical protein